MWSEGCEGVCSSVYPGIFSTYEVPGEKWRLVFHQMETNRPGGGSQLFDGLQAERRRGLIWGICIDIQDTVTEVDPATFFLPGNAMIGKTKEEMTGGKDNG
jgi:hypothetical protein